MVVTEKDFRQVLAMFDKEDIPYINFGYLFNVMFHNVNRSKGSNYKVKVKKVGNNNERI